MVLMAYNRNVNNLMCLPCLQCIRLGHLENYNDNLNFSTILEEYQTFRKNIVSLLEHEKCRRADFIPLPTFLKLHLLVHCYN